MSGDFVKLPPEVRDLIWGFVMLPKDVPVTFALDYAGRLVASYEPCPDHQTVDRFETTNFSIFFTDRQTSDEARRVFYNTAHLDFAPDDFEDPDPSGRDYSAVPMRFFQQTAPHDLAAIRTVKFAVDILLKIWLDGSKQITHILHSPWAPGPLSAILWHTTILGFSV